MAVTHEGASKTEGFIEATGAKYAYAYDKRNGLGRYYGVRGIPDSILVDPQGTVVWRGHPGKISNKVIEKYIDGALERPLWEWPKSTKKLKKEIGAGKLAAALATAKALAAGDDDLAFTLTFVEGEIERRTKSLAKALEEGDYLTALRTAERDAKELGGLPEGDSAKAAVKSIKGDKQKKAIVGTQEEIEKILSKKLKNQKDLDKRLSRLKKLAKEFPDSIVADQAAAAADKLRKSAGAR